MKINLLYIVLVSCLSTGNLVYGQEQSLLHKIEGNGLDAPSYIFGTIHLVCPENLYFAPELKSALKETGQLVLELDFDDPAMMSAIQSGVMMDKGQTLEGMYTAEEFSVINDFTTNSFGQPATSFNTVKPFFLMSMLYPQLMGCQTASMEMELVKLANNDDIEVLGMETAREQLDALDVIGMDVQAKMLIESIQEYDEQKAQMLKMQELYANGNLDALNAYATEESENYGDFNEVMLSGRNLKWIHRIKSFMNEESTFFAVGAAHLGGEEGILNLLENEGYTITPVLMGEKQEATPEPADLGKMSKMLIGKWRIDESQIEEVAEEAIENATKQNPEVADQIAAQKSGIMSMVEASRKEYLADGTFKLVVPNAPTQSGSWKIEEETAMITEIDLNGTTTIKKITELNATTMVSIKEGETARILKRVD